MPRACAPEPVVLLHGVVLVALSSWFGIASLVDASWRDLFGVSAPVGAAIGAIGLVLGLACVMTSVSVLSRLPLTRGGCVTLAALALVDATWLALLLTGP